MYETVKQVLNNPEQFDKGCYEDNFLAFRCDSCPVREACSAVSAETNVSWWPAEMLAAYQAKLDEERELAEVTINARELRQHGVTFDVALPQGFYNEVYARAGQDPSGLVVWAYPAGNIFGFPVAIHPEGVAILREVGYRQPSREEVFRK